MAQFLKKGVEYNKITKKIEFNNKIIENLDYKFLNFLSKIEIVQSQNLNSNPNNSQLKKHQETETDFILK